MGEGGTPARSTPSVVVLSQSSMHVVPYLSAIAEIEDTLVDMLGADLVSLQPAGGRWADTVRERQRLRKLAGRWTATRPLQLDTVQRHHDVGVVIVNNLHQLGMLEALPHWRTYADRWVVFITEIWPSFVDSSLATLQRVVPCFDHVFTTMRWTVERLSAISGVPWTFVPHPVDVLHVPFYTDDHRNIDVANFGRRGEVQHATLAAWCERTDRFYQYDTGMPIITDHRQHRAHYVEQCARSKVFVSNFARFDQRDLHGGNVEFGLRYFEGLAAGTIMLGEHPAPERVREVIGDAPGIFDFAADATEMPAELLDLLADTAACDRVHAAHRALALRRHDVAHWWSSVVDTTGLPPAAGHHERLQRLEAAAAALTDGGPAA